MLFIYLFACGKLFQNVFLYTTLNYKVLQKGVIANG